MHIKSRWGSISSLQFFQIFLLAVFCLSIFGANVSPKDMKTYQILLMTILILFIILSYYEYRERQRLLAQNRMLEAQKVYVRNLEEFVATLRKEKHDIANHLSTISVLCKINTPDLAERIDNYLSNLTAQFQTSYRSFSTGNDYINALLAVKSNFAGENNMNLSVDFKAPIYELNLPDSDLISIFGNIIDNAFEALIKDTENGNKLVSISTCIENDLYHINISNNGPQIAEKNIPKIFESGFSTKEEKRDHGFGLYITKQTILRNKGTIKVVSTPDETVFKIAFVISSCSQEIGFSTALEV